MFRVYFGRRKQWVEVELDDVDPNTFQRKGGGRWGYYLGNLSRSNSAGLFGTLHMVKSRIREDIVAHELFHVWFDIVTSRGYQFSTANEERFATLFDELTRGFYREYNKIKKT